MPGAFHVHERDTVDAGDALDRMIRRRARADQRPLASRARTCSGSRSGSPSDRRRHRLRMDHLGAEVRQLHRFLVGERVDDRRVGNQARIGAEHAIDVGPDVDLVGVEQAADDRGGEVAAVAAERRLKAGRIARDEAGDDQRLVGFRLGGCPGVRHGTPASAPPDRALPTRRESPRAHRASGRAPAAGREPRDTA